jgi:hypothetical protein
MVTKSSSNWKHTPGSFDAVHTRECFPTDGNPYGIPSLARVPQKYTPAWMQPYRTRLSAAQRALLGAIHFFLDDYRFESVWNHPHKALNALRLYGQVVLSPDFSLYRDWPLAVQLWNTYRNRWCGAKWQAAGLVVVPSLSWSTAESYAFAFAGVPRRSLVAVSGVGMRTSDVVLFETGYREMVARLQPSLVLVYGPLRASLQALAPYREYPTRWQQIKGH